MVNRTPPNEIRKASVQWWDSCSIRVFCPFCQELHRHGFARPPSNSEPSPYEQEHYRLAHCDPVRDGKVRLLEYMFKFPVDTGSGSVIYEIDKENVRFIAGGACAIDDGAIKDTEIERLRADFEEQIKMSRRWTESTETIVPPNDSSIRRIDNVVSAMVEGKTETVRQYLESSPDAEIFLLGVDDWSAPGDDTEIADISAETSGKTALHFAACEAYPEMLKLLISKGADVNAADLNGRTPLMEAALWGRLENVELLLSNQADSARRCVDHKQSRRAIDFAKPMERNARERWVRSGRQHCLYKEDTRTRNLDRVEIVRILSDTADMPQTQPVQPLLDAFTYKPSPCGTSISLVASYSVPSKWKTIARMHRAGQLPEITAMSGWSHPSNEHIQVAGRDWTKEVLQLYSVMNLSPEAHRCDQGVVGQFNACHAEKQLIAYFIHRHLFLPSELQPPKIEELRPPQETCELTEHWKEVDQHQRRVQAEKEKP